MEEYTYEAEQEWDKGYADGHDAGYAEGWENGYKDGQDDCYCEYDGGSLENAEIRGWSAGRIEVIHEFIYRLEELENDIFWKGRNTQEIREALVDIIYDLRRA